MIRGRAAIIGNGVSGRGSQVAAVTASAAARGVVAGKAFPELKPVNADAYRTRETGLLAWLQVTPTEPQQLVWLNPQYGIDYDIRTSSGLDWKII
jgi:hypothetical protein